MAKQAKLTLGSWTSGDPIRLETPGFALRTLTADRVADPHRRFCQNSAFEMLATLPESLTIDQARSIAAQFARPVPAGRNIALFLLEIERKAPRAPVGLIAVACNAAHARADVVPILDAAVPSGKGAEALGAALDFLFNGLAMAKLICNVVGEDAATTAMIESLGFEREAVFREHFLGRDGAWLDVAVWGLLRDERQAPGGAGDAARKSP